MSSSRVPPNRRLRISPVSTFWRFPPSGIPATGLALLVLAAGSWACEADPLYPSFGEERELADHRQLDISFQSDRAVLRGTLYLPLVVGRRAAIVIHPGSSWTVREGWEDVAPFVTGLSTAVFSFDKRGQGESTGTCCNPDPNVAFDRLARDLVEAVAVVRRSDRVDSDRVGVLGSSLGGWVAPLAANMAPDRVAFVISAVGGVVSSGQESAYDHLTGYDVCAPTGRPLPVVLDSLRALGPSGFDPKASLETLAQPALWLYGGNDLSHPTGLAVELIDSLRGSRDWTVQVFPNANHDLIDNGTICQTEGPMVDVLTPVQQWMEVRFP